MAKTVTDAAIMLGVLKSASRSERSSDPNLHAAAPPRLHAVLNADGLKGARIGIPRAFYYDAITLAGEEKPRGGLNPDQKKAMDEAIAILKQQGRDCDRCGHSVVDKDPANRVFGGFQVRHETRLQHPAKPLGPSAPVKTLSKLRSWNTANQKLGAINYGQSNLNISDEIDLVADRACYEAA
jgi:amidase